MKTITRTVAAALLLVCTLAGSAKADTTVNVTKDNALSYGISLGVGLAAQKFLPDTLSPNIKTGLALFLSVASAMIVEGQKANAQYRDFDNTNIVAGLGGGLTALQFRF